jgi:hypothetical protein
MTLISKDEWVSEPLMLGRSELLQGADGRKWSLSARSSVVRHVVKVEETWFPQPDGYKESAVIENLVIDGRDHGVTGILLDNVCKCQIRNVTIKNCDVGIHIRLRNGLWSESNCLRHIRMENVNKGILFTTTGPGDVTKKLPGDSAAFTTIDDVRIELADRNGTVGIQVGGKQIIYDPYTAPADKDNTCIAPYSGRIRANVWVKNSDGVGLKLVNGELGYGQTHLTVHKLGAKGGIGVDLHEFDPTALWNYNSGFAYRPIWKNQRLTFDTNTGSFVDKGFMLVTSNIQTPIHNPANRETDIQTKIFPP